MSIPAVGRGVDPRAAGDDGRDVTPSVGGRPERRRRAGARPEVTEVQRPRVPTPPKPVGGSEEPRGQQVDVEASFVRGVFRFRQQVEQEGPEGPSAQYVRDVRVPRTLPAAAAAVREDDEARRGVRDDQFPLEGRPVDRDGHEAL